MSCRLSDGVNVTLMDVCAAAGLLHTGKQVAALHKGRALDEMNSEEIKALAAMVAEQAQR